MSSLNETNKGMRVAIAFLGRRNAGKSSLINALVGYDLAIISDIPGTTTDPVSKAVEIKPLGPCMVIDTAGIDDTGTLGEMRIKKTRQVIEDTDVGIIVIGDDEWSEFEENIYNLLAAKGKPVIAVLNKQDLKTDCNLEKKLQERNISYVQTSATKGEGILALKEKLRQLKDVSSLEEPALLGGLINPGDLLVLVVPIDTGAPKGRLILPQVQTIRDILDNNASALVLKENGLADALDKLANPPSLVITDSQVILEVSRIVPAEIPLTTFSTLFSRFKGDLPTMVKGTRVVETLQNGDKVLIAEACTHHPLQDDIGRVKIPRWIRQYTGKELQFDIAAGPNFSENIGDYKLIIQCGGCTITRRAYLNRIEKALEKGVAITNYGVAISFVQGVLARVIKPFPECSGLI